MALGACAPPATEGASASGTRPAPPPFIPRALVALDTLGIGELRFRLAINGRALPGTTRVLGEETRLTLDPAFLDGASNEVRIEFLLLVPGGIERPLASATERLDGTVPGAVLTLSGLRYRYVDTDGDGLFDVHELAALPADGDGDGLDAFEDDDSDGDGLADADDPSPHGGVGTGGGGRIAFEVESPGGSRATIAIERVVGDSGESRALAEAGTAIEWRVPSGWPFVADPDDVSTRLWTAYELVGEESESCAHWRIELDASSLASSLSQLALLHFRRFDGVSFVAPIGAGSVENLDAFEHAGPLDGDGPWNDGLRVVLVPRDTVGWLELWTDRAFSGEPCRLNLTTPVPYSR